MTLGWRRLVFGLAGLFLSLFLIFFLFQGPATSADDFRAVPSTSFSISSGGVDPKAFAGNAFRGAIELRSTRKRFGGFSGLHVGTTGKRFTAVSDRGAWLQADLVYEAGRLVGARNAGFKRLRNAKGKKLKGSEGDAEALSSDGAGGFLVAFERNHRILHYPGWRQPFRLRPREMAVPRVLWTFPPNHGIEAMTRLCDGRYMAIAERGEGQEKGGETDDVVWLGKDGVWERRPISRGPAFSITGAATLPDCSVALLERQSQSPGRWITRIRRISATVFEKQSKSPLGGTIIIAPFLSGAKFEGLGIHAPRPGKNMILLVADNDFKGATILAAFSLDQDR